MNSPPSFKGQDQDFTSFQGFRPAFLTGTLGQGGAERQLVYILKCLTENGAKPSLLCLTQNEFWEDRIRELGIPIHFIGQSSSRINRLIKILKTLRALEPHVCQSQHFYTNIYTGLAGRWLNIPSIGAVRNNGLHELKSTGWPLGSLSLQLPKWIAANSRHAIHNLQAKGYDPGKFILLPNVIDSDRFIPATRLPAAKPFLVMGVGRLESQKRFDRFLDILALVAQNRNGVIAARIVGDGALRHSLAAAASAVTALGLPVELMGAVADPIDCYRKAGALLLTSDFEGTPNAVMEAMACGLPTVATNINGVAELVQHGQNGFLFEPADVQTAADFLQQLATDPELANRLGNRGRSLIESRHALNRLPEFLLGLYSRVYPDFGQRRFSPTDALQLR